MLTPRTPRSCDGPRGSLSMRPLGLAGQRALQARLARLCRSHRSPSDRRTTGVSPHHTMTCTDVGGRATDGAGSSVAAEWSDRARTVALQPLSGWCECVYKPGWLWPLRMAKRVSRERERRDEAKKGRARRHHHRPPGHRTLHSRTAHCARNDTCDRRGQGGLVFLALVGPAVRLLGDSAPRWPAGSPAQWQRPQMWICVGPRDPSTKPSRGCLRVVELSAIPQLPP